MGIRTQTLLRKLKKNISRAEHPRLAGEDDILSRGSHPPSATKKKKQITYELPQIVRTVQKSTLR
jgi:hypothetical protein